MKKLLVVGCLLTIVVTPAFAQASVVRDERPFANSQKIGHNGHSAFAQGHWRTRHSFHAQQKANNDVGIFENLPAGVSDPYAYHNELMRED